MKITPIILVLFVFSLTTTTFQVLELIQAHTSLGSGAPRRLALPDSADSGREGAEGSERETEAMLKDINAWLVINSMRSEKVQFNMLCEQQLNNLWVKQAFGHLTSHHSYVGMTPLPPPPPGFMPSEEELKLQQEAEEMLKQEQEFVNKCVDLFRVRLDWSVENAIPNLEGFASKLRSACEHHAVFLKDDTQRRLADEIIARCSSMVKLEAPPPQAPQAEGGADVKVRASSEQVSYYHSHISQSYSTLYYHHLDVLS